MTRHHEPDIDELCPPVPKCPSCGEINDDLYHCPSCDRWLCYECVPWVCESCGERICHHCHTKCDDLDCHVGECLTDIAHSQAEMPEYRPVIEDLQAAMLWELMNR